MPRPYASQPADVRVAIGVSSYGEALIGELRLLAAYGFDIDWRTAQVGRALLWSPGRNIVDRVPAPMLQVVDRIGAAFSMRHAYRRIQRQLYECITTRVQYEWMGVTEQ